MASRPMPKRVEDFVRSRVPPNPLENRVLYTAPAKERLSSLSPKTEQKTDDGL